MKAIVRLNPEYEFYLASRSPRRRDMLKALGIPLAIVTADEKEKEPTPGEKPESYTSGLSRAKAEAALALLPKTSKKAIVLAADTVVVTKEGRILGKPENANGALAMLKSLCGTTHTVTTAVTLLSPSRPEESFTFADTCQVSFGTFSTDILESYVATGEPMDKAGAYAVQGKGAFLVKSLQGSWTTVVGLPLEQLTARLCALKILFPNTDRETNRL